VTWTGVVSTCIRDAHYASDDATDKPPHIRLQHLILPGNVAGFCECARAGGRGANVFQSAMMKAARDLRS